MAKKEGAYVFCLFWRRNNKHQPVPWVDVTTVIEPHWGHRSLTLQGGHGAAPVTPPSYTATGRVLRRLDRQPRPPPEKLGPV